MTLKSEWCKINSWLTLGPKNDVRNFNANCGKSENLHFDVLFLSKVYYVLAKKHRGVMCHNTEEWCKIWGRTDLCFKKWHEV